MRTDLDTKSQVTGSTSGGAGIALATNPESRSGRDACRNLHLDRLNRTVTACKSDGLGATNCSGHEGNSDLVFKVRASSLPGLPLPPAAGETTEVIPSTSAEITLTRSSSASTAEEVPEDALEGLRIDITPGATSGLGSSAGMPGDTGMAELVVA